MGFSKCKEPFHTEHIAQVHQTKHWQSTVQVEHICTQCHSILPSLPLQGRAQLCGAPLPLPPPVYQEDNALLLTIMFCQVGPTTCPGPVHLFVLTHYLVACYE